MHEDSKLIRAIYELKPEIDKLVFIGELCNCAGAGEFIPVGRITAGLTQICLDVIMSFEKVYRHVGDVDYSLRCYEASYDCACQYEDKSPVICHGQVKHFEMTYIHAWVEVNNEVYDWTKCRQPLDKANYYLEQGIESAPIRYSFLEFCKLRIEFGHFGPFDESFKN